MQTSDEMGQLSFTEITVLPHASGNDEESLFLTVTSTTGKKLSLTPDHYIPTCSLTGAMWKVVSWLVGEAFTCLSMCALPGPPAHLTSDVLTYSHCPILSPSPHPIPSLP